MIKGKELLVMQATIHLFPRVSATVCGLLLSAILAVPATAQISPVAVKVIKKITYNPTTNYSSDGWGMLTSTSTGYKRTPAYYAIEVVNKGIKKYDEMKIKWAALVQNPATKDETVEQGEKEFSLDDSKKFEHDVHAKTRGAEVLGCSVEVYIGDGMVTSETQPLNVKDKITKLKTE